MIFKASLDGLAKGITTAILVLFASIIIFQLIPSYAIDAIGASFLIGALLSISLLCLLYRPIQYVLTDNALIVHRLIGDIVVKRVDILTAQEVRKVDMGLTIRTFGVGGFFGYFGKYYNSKIGSLKMYATRRNNTVLIDTGTRKIIISPDNHIELVKQLRIVK